MLPLLFLALFLSHLHLVSVRLCECFVLDSPVSVVRNTRLVLTLQTIPNAFGNGRQSLQPRIQALVEQGRTVGEVKSAVGDEAAVTFSFLTMQLHARGSQQFWREQNDRKTAAYLVYRLADIYADVLTKVQADGYNPEYCREVLEWLGSERCFDSFEAQFLALATLVHRQRAGKPDEWMADAQSIDAVMRDFGTSDAAAVRVNDNLVWYAVGAAAIVVVGVVVMRLTR